MKHQSREGRDGVYRAFTLVELLVVIGIIALLISILLPVMGRARESGRRIACISNLRQIAMGALMYEQEHKVLPGPVIPALLDYEVVNAVPSPLDLDAANAPHWKARQWTSKDGGFMRYVSNSKSVFYCPSSTEIRTEAIAVSGTYSGQRLGYCYKVNNQLDSNPPFFFGSHSFTTYGPTGSNPQPEYLKPKKIASIKAAGNNTGTGTYKSWSANAKSHVVIWMLSDIDGRNFATNVSASMGFVNASLYPTTTLDPLDPGLDKRPFQPIHKSGKIGRNYAFFDGHAEWRSFDDLPKNP